jgi:hypothetical protein
MPVRWDTAVLIAIAVISFAPPAAAYVDPGSTSMMLQIIIGGVAAVMLVTRQLWTNAAGKTTRFFRRGTKPPHDTRHRDAGK